MNKALIELSFTLTLLLGMGMPTATADKVRDDVPLLEQLPAEIIDGIPIGQVVPAASPRSGIDLFPIGSGHAWGVQHHEDGSATIFHCDAELGQCRTMDWLPGAPQKK